MNWQTLSYPVFSGAAYAIFALVMSGILSGYPVSALLVRLYFMTGIGAVAWRLATKPAHEAFLPPIPQLPEMWSPLGALAILAFLAALALIVVLGDAPIMRAYQMSLTVWDLVRTTVLISLAVPLITAVAKPILEGKRLSGWQMLGGAVMVIGACISIGLGTWLANMGAESPPSQETVTR